MKKENKFIIVAVVLVVAGLVAARQYYKTKSFGVAESSSSTYSQPLRGESSLLLGPVTYSQGPATARVQLVEFLDPECESCAAIHPYVKSILNDFSGSIYYVARYMPFHKNSVYAASMIEAAGLQGKYWEALDLLFDKQPTWASHHDPRPQMIPEFLKTLGLDMKRLDKDARKPEIAAKIEQDHKDGMQVGVNGTPSFFVNGRPVPDLRDSTIRQMIQEEMDGTGAK